MEQKSSEVLQAQGAAYAEEGIGWDDLGIEVYRRSDEVYRGIGGATLNYAGLTDSDGVARYLRKVRQEHGPQYEPIDFRTKSLENYRDNFKASIDEMLDDGKDNNPDDYSVMGSGENSMVYRLDIDGKGYAVRVPSGKEVDARVVDTHLAAGVLAKDIPHTEKIIAASYEDGITVSEVMPGVGMDEKITLDTTKSITDTQMEDLVDTLVAINEKGLIFDHNPNNILYDKDQGFGVIDLRSSKGTHNLGDAQDPGVVVGLMSGVLKDMGVKSLGVDASVDDYGDNLNQLMSNKEVMLRYKGIVDNKLSGEYRETALGMLGEQAYIIDELIKEYSNSNWSDRVSTNKDIKSVIGGIDGMGSF